MQTHILNEKLKQKDEILRESDQKYIASSLNSYMVHIFYTWSGCAFALRSMYCYFWLVKCLEYNQSLQYWHTAYGLHDIEFCFKMARSDLQKCFKEPELSWRLYRWDLFHKHESVRCHCHTLWAKSFSFHFKVNDALVLLSMFLSNRNLSFHRAQTWKEDSEMPS